VVKKTLIAASAISMSALMLSACGGGDSASGADDGTITMGFAQVGAESGWRTANTKSVQESAKEAGIELKFSDAQQKQENQIKAIRSYIQQKVDVIAFSPVVPRRRQRGHVALRDVPRLRLRRGGREGGSVAGRQRRRGRRGRRR
jgi:ABC-type sugar transport system substrate-binding protein